MIPAVRLLVVLTCLAVLALVASIWPPLQPLFKWVAIGMLATVLVDAARAFAIPTLSVEREHSGTLPLDMPSEVRLSVRNEGHRRFRLELFDHHPQHAVVDGLPQSLTVEAATIAQCSYELKPMRRGQWNFDGVQLRIWSPLGFWQRRRYVGPSTSVRVYPNFAPVIKYSLLATENRLSQMGIKRSRRRGEGMEFEQLRDYRLGDPLRQIDWNASSRVQRLISREYEEERDQEVIFLLDCGRRMRSEDGALSHFDHALNAVLLLSHVALRQGDAVGAMSFAGPPRYLAPRKGVSAVNTVLNTLYDIHPGLATPDYSKAARDLLLRQRKRSLVVLVSNLRDEDASDLLPALELLRQRHLVLVASLREAVIDQALAAPVDDFDSALEYSAVHDYLAARQETHAAIAGRGALLVDVTPAQLPLAIVNRYLDAKRSGYL